MEQAMLEVLSNPKSHAAEAYRILRTNLQFSSLDREIKTIVITSSIPGEGKTTTIANLAITFAQSGSRVLLVDTDLRKPRIHKLFGLENNKGITTLLSQHETIESCIYNEFDNLDIICCGPIPPNPSELLGSYAMKDIIEKFKEQYDVILFDSAPVNNVTDATILGAICDGVILVAKSGIVDIYAVRKAKEMLNNVNANILGVVLNSINNKNQNAYYYYQYYYEEES
ncbi:MAG: CpsD/CapB family tyrosine-protein kinase [Deltaproteobacteria bacterium]